MPLATWAVVRQHDAGSCAPCRAVCLSASPGHVEAAWPQLDPLRAAAPMCAMPVARRLTAGATGQTYSACDPFTGAGLVRSPLRRLQRSAQSCPRSITCGQSSSGVPPGACPSWAQCVSHPCCRVANREPMAFQPSGDDGDGVYAYMQRVMTPVITPRWRPRSCSASSFMWRPH